MAQFPHSAKKPNYPFSWIASGQSACRILLLVLMVAVAISVVGCSSIRLKPDAEVAPSANAEKVWISSASTASASDSLSQLRQLRRPNENDTLSPVGSQPYDLPSLVDLALRMSPETQHAWYAALETEGQLGRSQAPDYPKVEAQAEGGYVKAPIQFPGETLIIRNYAFFPQFKVSYDLLDFGRTRAEERNAREQLIAANYTFNQSIQDLVFQVERAYFTLSAAYASVSAAETNLVLADTALSSVENRHQVGLATLPQLLLARQVQAQAVYDLENARSTVHDAEAELRQAVGIAADTDVRIKSGELDRLPPDLGDDVELLMIDALKQRPDIASQAASVRAADASIARARSEFYPQISVSGSYGQSIWSYTLTVEVLRI